MRKRSMESMGESQKRKKETIPMRQRSTGSDTIKYLKEKYEKDLEFKKDDLELKK